MSTLTATKSTHPNIVLIVSDEQRWDSLGCNGNTASQTPNVDSLSAAGASLNHAYATYPLCCPSRMSLWTGLMPHDHLGFGNWRALREDLRDQGLVAPFARAGYHTIYNGKWHVPGSTPARFGFADVDAVPAVLDGRDRGRYIEEYRAYATEQGYELVPGNIENLTARDVEQLHRPGKAPYATAEIAIEHWLEPWQTTRFIEALDRRPEDQPFFAVCSWNAPHFPMAVPEPYDRLVDPDTIALPPNFCAGLEGKPREVTDSPFYEPDWSEQEWRQLIAHYLGFCALIDDQVGRILDHLDAAGLRDDTIVVFVSDHGDMLGSHCLNKKGFPLHYEESLRVPLVMAGPGINADRRIEQLVSLTDLIPTLAELCHVELDVAHDGVSFAASLGGSSTVNGRDVVISESFQVDAKESGSGDAIDLASLDVSRLAANVSARTSTHRYIFRRHDHDELYDMQSDPFELENIISRDSSSEIAHRLRQVIASSLEQSLPQVAEAVRTSPEGSASTVSLQHS